MTVNAGFSRWIGRKWEAAGLAVIALALAASAGCSGNRLLTRKDYELSQWAISEGNYAEAREKFPKGERGTFITSMEKAYLDLLQGKSDLAGLKKYRDIADERVRFQVSREISDFFYMSTPEGYYASEHEIVWMHMLLSWGYALQRQYDNACVEARSASYLLQLPWSQTGHFDDPALRIVLAGLWSMCGSWEDAQVMLRGAAALDPSLTWARDLAERDRPPRNLFLVLGGVGPDPYWDPALDLNPLRGARHLGFKPQGRRDALIVRGGANPVAMELSPGSLPWYQRHLVRDNEIHDLIGDTHYALSTTGEAGLYAARTTGAAAVLAFWTVLGLTGGYAVAELCVHTNCGEGVVLIIALPIAGIGKGANEYQRLEQQARERFNEQSDPSNFYRFVRLLPEYAWMGWSDDPSLPDEVALAYGAGNSSAKAGTAHAVGQRVRSPRVYLGQLPDTEPPSPVPKPTETAGP
jgi:hypothetical protein